MKTTLINSYTGQNPYYSNKRIAEFLGVHLDEYGDPTKDILKAIEYSQDKQHGKGGFTLLVTDNNSDQPHDANILGAVVINETNMSGYIPENILVYIAVHSEHRGHGIGKKLLDETLKYCKGDIALHVEKDNPARFLYKKAGFTTPYLEMRLKR